MIKFNSNKYEFCVLKATFTDNGEPRTQYGNDRQYWEKMVAMWGHLNSLHIEAVTPTAEQQQRLQDLNAQEGLSENWLGSAADFVEHGVILPDSDCPFLENLKPAYQGTTLSYFKDAVRNDLAAYRYDKEVGGIKFGGAMVATDRSSQSMLNAAVTKAEKDPTFTVDWKTKNGFVALDAPSLIALGNAVSNHVQKCFSTECKVERDHITPATDLDALANLDIESLFEGYYSE